MRNEDFGLSEGEFVEGEQVRKWADASESGKEYQKNSRLYFEFGSTKERDRAIEFLNTERELKKDFDELYRYLEKVGVDTIRPREGIEIKFSKNPQLLRKKFLELLQSQGFRVLEDYKTEGVDEVSPAPVPTPIRQAEVIPFPKKDDTHLPKAA